MAQGDHAATSSTTAVRELLPMIGIIFAFPIQFALAWAVFMMAQVSRAFYRILLAPRDLRANLRVLVVTDYMPPQTHGIAIRFSQYVKEMRKSTHEVHVFTTKMRDKAITSFDHPDIPCMANPYNGGNLMGYAPGIKLAWYLGANSWDIVHIAYPSTLGWFILPACRWRNIPAYCSHHVDMDLYMKRYMPVHWVWWIGTSMYNLFMKWPAAHWSTVNASMTRVFLRSHMPDAFDRPDQMTVAIPTGIAHYRFTDEATSDQLTDDTMVDPLHTVIELKERLGRKKLWVMVQRVAVEKDIHLVIEAMPAAVGEAHLVIAGDGPALVGLQQLTSEMNLESSITFLGNVPNAELPRLYRMGDCFVTCSISETYGLTNLEALSCCTPIAYPACDVFDEIWQERLPAEWRFDQSSAEGLLSAARAASMPEARDWLRAHPVSSSWTTATAEMLEQYKEAIEMIKKRKEKRLTFKDWILVERAEHFVRIAVIAVVVYWIGRVYLGWAYQTMNILLLLFGSSSMVGALTSKKVMTALFMGIGFFAWVHLNLYTAIST